MKKILLSVIIMLAMINIATAKTCKDEINEKFKIFDEVATRDGDEPYCQLIKKNELGVQTWFCYVKTKDWLIRIGACYTCANFNKGEVKSLMLNTDPFECFKFNY